ncbi:hypothetical protein [Sphingomonas sp. ACRSK]|uniref:hypothetical protein n=1 Tax=Sphingomonas sp. ACRSK TaxID=2918213 RepID=UPI001EF3EEDA|nr:hypothetical protein [Sphingomonas sp. ACRSK]MCG7349922.1 hypothetical protein [Sphingomonas sp. ACRSK]
MEAELWAEARTIEEAHGELAPAWVAEQTVALMRADNCDGEARMRRVDVLLTQLRHGHTEGDLPQRHAQKLC